MSGSIYAQEEPAVSCRLNRLSLNNNRLQPVQLKVKAADNLQVILEESVEYTSNE